MITICDYTKFRPEGEVERALSFACKQLGISDVTVVASINDKLLKKISAKSDTEYQALLFEANAPHTYNLYFRPNLPVSHFIEMIFHEAVHMKQQERGDLSLDITTGECLWKGETYFADYPYKDRPWEKEAFKEQAELLNAYRASQKAGGRKKQSGCLLAILFIILLITNVSWLISTCMPLL